MKVRIAAQEWYPVYEVHEDTYPEDLQIDLSPKQIEQIREVTAAFRESQDMLRTLVRDEAARRDEARRVAVIEQRRIEWGRRRPYRRSHPQSH